MSRLVIHPGITEAPRVFSRLKDHARKEGHSVVFHACMDDADDIKVESDDKHIAHSAGYICQLVREAKFSCIIAPPTNDAHAKAFFRKLATDYKDAWRYKEHSLFFYKHASASEQLLFNLKYWRRMQAAFRVAPPPPPLRSLVILYANDTWSDGHDWSEHTLITLPGQHDEILYRPEPTLRVIFDKLK